MHQDLFGRALWDYVNGRRRDMITWTQLSPPEILRTDYLFRDFDRMPEGERRALEMSRGRILDVGAGSGSHSLWLQEQGRDVMALDASILACRTMEKRGVRHIIPRDFFACKPFRRFDTLLLLMNGAGIMQRAARIDAFFEQLNALTAPGGQVLIHSSDIYYLYPAFDLPLPLDTYYGDVDFHIKYGDACQQFPWTYPDPDLLSLHAGRHGFRVHRVCENEDGDVLLQCLKEG